MLIDFHTLKIINTHKLYQFCVDRFYLNDMDIVRDNHHLFTIYCICNCLQTLSILMNPNFCSVDWSYRMDVSNWEESWFIWSQDNEKVSSDIHKHIFAYYNIHYHDMLMFIVFLSCFNQLLCIYSMINIMLLNIFNRFKYNK
jgi:hypothetical protein